MKKKEFNLIEFFLFRWAIMIGVVTINMLLIFLLIIGLFKNSKGSLCLYVINLAIYFNYSEYLKKKLFKFKFRICGSFIFDIDMGFECILFKHNCIYCRLLYFARSVCLDCCGQKSYKKL